MSLMKDPENRLSPLPGYLENYRETITNFGLFFQKFGKYHLHPDNELKTQHSWDNGQRGRDKKNFEWSLINNQIDHYNGKFKADPRALENRHKLQREALASLVDLNLDVFELMAIAATRFLTGIGELTPTEVGMVFDRNTGLPFIPASSIKGAVRQAYCANFARNNENLIGHDGTIREEDISGLIEIFGSLDAKKARRGGFSFLDAFSKSTPEMVIDIMNPHHAKYYQGENPDGPVETEEPIPIKFLALEKGVHFVFRGFFLNDAAQIFRKELRAAFETALTELGLGAKTASGYGRFHNIEETTPAMLETITKMRRQKAEEAEKEHKIEEEKKRQDDLENMTPEERDVAELMSPKITENKVVEVLNKLDNFLEANRKQAAQAIKNYYQANNKWEKKKINTKQLEKVKKIKAILGEE